MLTIMLAVSRGSTSLVGAIAIWIGTGIVIGFHIVHWRSTWKWIATGDYSGLPFRKAVKKT